MKQIILILLFLTASVFANDIDERKTDLYFGNGVWNSYAMAKDGRDKLQKKVDKWIIKGNQQLKEKYSKVKLVYNWTGTSPDNSVSYETKIYDVIETFYQLKKEGQLDTLANVYDYITYFMSDDITQEIDDIDAILESYTSSITTDNIVEMLEKYNENSFYKSHRVLLIAHSQGNLFGNSVYDALGWKKDYFKMVSIATPAKRVADTKSPYTTFKCDRVINNWLGTSFLPVGIPGHLPGNTECTENELDGDAHKLVEYYLSNANSVNDIMTNVENQLLNLEAKPSQWKKSSEFACGCDKRINVVHEYDSSLDTLMKDISSITPKSEAVTVSLNCNNFDLDLTSNQVKIHYHITNYNKA